MEKKLNCWEFMRCGKAGSCPVSLEESLDTVHGGVNAGRACWAVNGTLCGEGRQGTFTEKFLTCVKCDFYKKVREEELPNVEPTSSLIRKIGFHSARRKSGNEFAYQQ